MKTKLLNKKGSALLASYFVTTILLILGSAFLLLATNESRVSERQRKTAQAFYIAEAGIERAIYDLRQEFVGGGGNENWSDGLINSIVLNTSDLDADGFYPIPYGTTTLGEGFYTVRLKHIDSDETWVRCVGTVGDASQEIEVYLKMQNVSPWSNAIFGGAGSAGGMVNGNVKIHGSVHILGDGIPGGGNAIDLGGTAELVGNNYQGLDSALRDKVPDLPTVLFNGETIETLNSDLRVKNGIVGLSGSSTVGDADVFGNGYKETVNATYVTDGYNGNKGTVNVFSDNGYSNGYDLGDAVSFPSLNDPVQGYANSYDYFNAEAYTPTAGERAVLANLTPLTPDFIYSSTGDCTAANCIQMTGGQLFIKGKIYVNGGGVGFNGGEMKYTGVGTILATGNVTINENIITYGDDSFPNNVLGIMTPGNINIGAGSGASQLDVMGLFYAGTEIEVAKQTDLVGTIVTNYFDISGQVPSIFQVPETVNNLPDGMVGSDADAWWLRTLLWKKR